MTVILANWPSIPAMCPKFEVKNCAKEYLAEQKNNALF